MPRSSTRKNAPKYGGKWLGEGTYGCGFGPPLKCKKNATRRSGPIMSKMLTSKRATNLEVRESERIKDVDPYKRFFITADDMCEHDQTNIRPTNETEKCGKFAKLPAQTYLIFYEMGGDNLSKLKVPYNRVFQFLNGLQRLFQGLEILHAGGVVHLDIKPDNIVGKLLPSGQFLIRYIDFGLSKKIDEITPDDIYSAGQHELNNYYPWYPLDTIFGTEPYYQPENSVKQSNIQYFNKDLQDWYRNSFTPHVVGEKQFLNTNGDKYNGQTFYDKISQNIPFYSDTERFVKTIDVYSLGVVLAQMIMAITGHRPIYYNHTKKQISTVFIKPTAGSPFLLKESLKFAPVFGIDEDVFNWHKKLLGFTQGAYDLIAKMTDMFAPNRVTAAEARGIYGSLIGRLGGLFYDEDLVKRALSVTSQEKLNINAATFEPGLKREPGKRFLVPRANTAKQTAPVLPAVEQYLAGTPAEPARPLGRGRRLRRTARPKYPAYQPPTNLPTTAAPAVAPGPRRHVPYLNQNNTSPAVTPVTAAGPVTAAVPQARPFPVARRGAVPLFPSNSTPRVATPLTVNPVQNLARQQQQQVPARNPRAGRFAFDPAYDF